MFVFEVDTKKDANYFVNFLRFFVKRFVIKISFKKFIHQSVKVFVVVVLVVVTVVVLDDEIGFLSDWICENLKEGRNNRLVFVLGIKKTSD